MKNLAFNTTYDPCCVPPKDTDIQSLANAAEHWLDQHID
jgi:hypothetical protein